MTLSPLLPWLLTAAIGLGGAAAVNLWPLAVIGKIYLVPVLLAVSLAGIVIAPLPVLAVITTIGAIKLEALFTLPEGLDWTMPIGLCLSLLVALRLATDPDPRPYPRTLLILATSFACLWLLSTWWTSSPLYGTTKALALVAVTGVIAAGPAAYLRTDRHWAWYLATIMAVAGVVAIELLRHAADEEVSRSAFGGSYLGSARVIGLGILLAITAVVIRPEAGKWALLAIAGCGLGLIAMLKSGARGPLLALAVTLILLAIASCRGDWTPSRRRLRWIALCLPIGAGLALLLFPERFETMLVRGALLVTMNGNSIESRVERVGMAESMWQHAPLLGNGAGSFNWVFGWGEKYRGAYPHNLFLEILSETGLVGLLLLLGLLVWAGVTIWRLSGQPAAHPWITPVTGLFCYSLINAMVSGDLNSNRGVFASLGLLAALHLRTTPHSGVFPHASLPHQPLRHDP